LRPGLGVLCAEGTMGIHCTSRRLPTVAEPAAKRTGLWEPRGLLTRSGEEPRPMLASWRRGP